MISAPDGAPRSPEASIGRVAGARYDGLADEYDAFQNRQARYFEAAAEALARLLGRGAGRCLDVGCGGGHFFEVPLKLGWEVVGVDPSQDQLRVARRRHPEVELLHADASSLPYGDGSFDLIALGNMIPFFDELARVVAPSGFVLFAFSAGPQTPIYVPPQRLRKELGRRGFSQFAEISAGPGTALVARAPDDA